jgi:hypothetical protein
MAIVTLGAPTSRTYLIEKHKSYRCNQTSIAAQTIFHKIELDEIYIGGREKPGK